MEFLTTTSLSINRLACFRSIGIQNLSLILGLRNILLNSPFPSSGRSGRQHNPSHDGFSKTALISSYRFACCRLTFLCNPPVLPQE